MDLAKRKVHNFDRGRGFANINFHGKEGKFGLNLYDSLNTDFNLKKNVFEIDMPPSFLLWRIVIPGFQNELTVQKYRITLGCSSDSLSNAT